jgi:hypothetical protein
MAELEHKSNWKKGARKMWSSRYLLLYWVCSSFVVRGGGKICGLGSMYYTVVYTGCIPPPHDAPVLGARSTRFPTKSNSVAVGVRSARSLAFHDSTGGSLFLLYCSTRILTGLILDSRA